MKTVMAALETIEKKMSTQVSAERFDELAEQQAKLAKQLLDLQQKGLNLNIPQKKAVKSIGEQVVDNSAFKSYLAGSAPRRKQTIRAQLLSLKIPCSLPGMAFYRRTDDRGFCRKVYVRCPSRRYSRVLLSPAIRLNMFRRRASTMEQI